MRLSTAREIAQEHDLDLPWRDEDRFRQCFQYTPGVNTFFSCFHKDLWVTEKVIRVLGVLAVKLVAENTT